MEGFENVVFYWEGKGAREVEALHKIGFVWDRRPLDEKQAEKATLELLKQEVIKPENWDGQRYFVRPSCRCTNTGGVTLKGQVWLLPSAFVTASEVQSLADFLVANSFEVQLIDSTPAIWVRRLEN